MDSYSYFDNDIAIVGMGCLLPDANSPEEFWENIRSSKCSIKPISSNRWEKDFNFSPYRELDDKTYSFYGAEIPEEKYKELKAKHGLDLTTRLEIMAIEAMSQATQDLKLPEDRKRISTILGIMNPDEFYYSNITFLKRDEVLAKIEAKLGVEDSKRAAEIVKHYEDEYFSLFKPDLSYTIPTSVINSLNDKFEIRGKSFLVDAACASSLASIDLCVRKLKNFEIDLAFAGGLESNLSPGSFVLFSKVGALAIEKCLPFDAQSDGLSQGEGAVIFALERLSDALKNKHHIHGIIKSSEGSSDGKAASLFQPTVNGQLLAYSRAYKNFDSNRVDYIEAHGTGTKIGDATEMQSLSLFFRDFKTPIGSVKALIGHTKATAGAASLLKEIFMMKNRVLPASHYFNKFYNDLKLDVYVNKTEEKFKNRELPLRFGISSLGFGGCNYHLVVDEYMPQIKLRSGHSYAKDPREVAIVGKSYFGIEEFNPNDFTSKESKFRLPPKSLPQIDVIQLLAVKAVHAAFESANINPDLLDRDNVIVISASATGLPILEKMAFRITYDTLGEMARIDALKETKENSDLLKKVAIELDNIKEQYDRITEDSGPGILNNVIAGRVCNAFNFKGKAFNIDCDEASIACALDVIKTELQEQGTNKFVILIGSHENLNTDELKMSRLGVSCLLCTNTEYANLEMMKILETIKI